MERQPGWRSTPCLSVLQPKVEAEIAFVLAADLADGDLGYDQVRAAIGYAVPAIEICGSRVANWDISFGDTVADNASAGAYVLGTQRKTLAEFDPVVAEMRMTVTGTDDSTGSGAACLGDPVNAVVWLARQARVQGLQHLRGHRVPAGGAAAARLSNGRCQVRRVLGTSRLDMPLSSTPAALSSRRNR